MNVENVCSIKYSADLIYVTLSISNIKRSIILFIDLKETYTIRKKCCSFLKILMKILVVYHHQTFSRGH